MWAGDSYPEIIDTLKYVQKNTTGYKNRNVLKHDSAKACTKGPESTSRYGFEFGCRDKLDSANSNYYGCDCTARDCQWQLLVYWSAVWQASQERNSARSMEHGFELSTYGPGNLKQAN